MTIDEAIKICEEDAEKIGGNLQSDRHAERCRQFAEWLKELKEAKRLLNMALCELNNGTCTKFCSTCTKVSTEKCKDYKHKFYHWVRTDEVLKLIGE